MKKIVSGITTLVLASSWLAVPSGIVFATDACTFTTVDTTMTLDGDCTTDTTIFVPNGMTLDGNDYTITAVDPTGGHFVGAVVQNGGVVASVRNLVITASELSDVCDSGTSRLRGIMFDGASGSIMHNTVRDLTQTGSGCQEGNSIEVRNAPFDGTHPNTLLVQVAQNTVTNFMKGGIVASGDVNVNVHNNTVGASANQSTLVANSIQLGFGALGKVTANNVAGNQWCGSSEVIATAILIYSVSSGVSVTSNRVSGNSDIGIYTDSDGVSLSNNIVTDDSSIDDCNENGYDIGIANDATLGVVKNNKVSGFDTPYALNGVSEKHNTTF